MDQHGDSHLAVIGIERDTKDGHYHYSAVRGRLAGLALLVLLVCACQTAAARPKGWERTA
jgi:hypothetical protein